MCELLGVVCIEVMAYVEAANPIRHVLCIDCELLQTDPRDMRNTTLRTNLPEAVIWRFECLRASCVVRATPLKLVLSDDEPISEYVDEYFVVNRSKVQRHKS